MTIKAIETFYNGYCFRSRLEARWAVFFDALNVRFEYEAQGFVLDGHSYLPDFWLPHLECWAEVKPITPTEDEEGLLEKLADETDHAAVFLIGTPPGCLWAYCSDCTDSSGGTRWWKDNEGSCVVCTPGYELIEFHGPHWSVDHRGQPCICSSNNWSSRSFLTPNFNVWDAMKILRECLHDFYHTDDPIWDATVAARSARFEHGETPGRI